MGAGEFREKFSDSPKTTSSAFSSTTGPAVKPSGFPERGTIVWNRTASSSSSGTHVRESETPYKTFISSAEKEISKVEASAQVVLETVLETDNQKASTSESFEQIPEIREDFRLVGEAMKTYIIIEKDGELLLIDKHAAHERMIFDALKSQGREIMSQSLLVPVTIKLPADEIELIEQSSEVLLSLGFEIEPYGEDSVILRGVPADTDAADAAPMVEEICDKLKRSSGAPQMDAIDDILHTVACKAAIKAGWNTQDSELLKIAKEVVSGRVKYCPHGRPVAITLTKKQLDKEFSRIV